MEDNATPAATSRERHSGRDGSWEVRVTPFQMHEVRTGLLIALLATDRLDRRRPDDQEVVHAALLVRRALARILTAVEAWNPPDILPTGGTGGVSSIAPRGLTVGEKHRDIAVLKDAFGMVLAELERPQLPEDNAKAREELYTALDHLYADLLAALRKVGR